MARVVTEFDRFDLGDRVADYLEPETAVSTRLTPIAEASGAVAVAELVDVNQAA